MSESAEFRCRVQLSSDEDVGVHTRIVLSDELTDPDPGGGSAEEWVAHHLDDWDFADYQKRFTLLGTGNFEIVFRGTIQGWYDNASQEFDEKIVVHEFSQQKLPDDFFLDYLVEEDWEDDCREYDGGIGVFDVI